jgi:hypothetical protein
VRNRQPKAPGLATGPLAQPPSARVEGHPRPHPPTLMFCQLPPPLKVMRVYTTGLSDRSVTASPSRRDDIWLAMKTPWGFVWGRVWFGLVGLGLAGFGACVG